MERTAFRVQATVPAGSLTQGHTSPHGCAWLSAGRRLTRDVPSSQVWQQGEYSGPTKEMDIDADFVPTAITHPDTYLNKVLLGSEDGRLLL